MSLPRREEVDAVSIEELAALDAAYRARLHQTAIAETRRGIAIRAAQHGRTDVLERQLAALLARGDDHVRTA